MNNPDQFLKRYFPKTMDIVFTNNEVIQRVRTEKKHSTLFMDIPSIVALTLLLVASPVVDIFDNLFRKPNKQI